MSLKEMLNGALDTVYEKTVDALGDVFARAELALDELLPDKTDEPTVEQKAEVLAGICPDTPEGRQAASNYRTGKVSDVIINVLYAAAIKAKPELAVKTANTNTMFDPERYIAYLKENFPAMAKVYEQSIRDQAWKDNLRHQSETETDGPVEGDNPWLNPDGTRNT